MGDEGRSREIEHANNIVVHNPVNSTEIDVLGLRKHKRRGRLSVSVSLFRSLCLSSMYVCMYVCITLFFLQENFTGWKIRVTSSLIEYCFFVGVQRRMEKLQYDACKHYSYRSPSRSTFVKKLVKNSKASYNFHSIDSIFD